MSFGVKKKKNEGTLPLPTLFYGKVMLISKFNKDSKRKVNYRVIHSYTDAKKKKF